MERGKRLVSSIHGLIFLSKLFLAAFLVTAITFVCATPAWADSGGEAVATDQNSKTSQKSQNTTVGDPLAAGMMDLLKDEVVGGFHRRHIEPQFGRFQNYAAGKLNATSGPVAVSEITGNCRLSWYNHLLRNPLLAPAEAEAFTRNLHAAVLKDDGLVPVTKIAAKKLDIADGSAPSYKKAKTPQEALDVVKQSLADAQTHYAAALAPLTRSEISSLAQKLYPILTRDNRVGHTLSSRGTGRYLCDLLEKTDREAMLSATQDLAALTNPALIAQLAKLPAAAGKAMDGVEGDVVRRVQTPAGDIIIGGPGNNTYQLDAMSDIAAVIDLGGDDTYYEGTCSVARPVLAIIDIAGNDTYQGSKPGIQGGAILGVSLLVDAAGDDTYQAKDLAQGSCLGGCGILLDMAGNDRYHGVKRLQGQAIAGVGMLIDRAGNDDYHAAMWAQGFGGPIGFGFSTTLPATTIFMPAVYTTIRMRKRPAMRAGRKHRSRLRQVSNGGVGRDSRRRRRRRLRVRLYCPWRRILARPGLRTRFWRKRPAAWRYSKGV